MRPRFLAAILAISGVSACSSDEGGAKPKGEDGGRGTSNEGGAKAEAGAPSFDATKRGPYPVGTLRFEMERDGRTLPVQLWYPAAATAKAEADTGHPLAELEPPGEHRDTLAALVAAAPTACTTRTVHCAFDAAPAERAEPWPVLLFSHCHSCLRFSELGVSERLASWGFVVAAPDHTDNTLWEQLAGNPAKIDGPFLQVRGKDISAVLDAVLEGADGVPEGLRGHLDADHVGMFGHSFGSVTTGLVLQDDPRVKAGVMIAAPPENPLLPGVTLANLTKPALFFLAEEDNSITLLGNQFIQSNFAAYPSAAWLVSVEDAGHWSFSDIAGLVDGFAAGCGEGKRQEDTTASFTYLDNDVGREVAARYVTAFFTAQFLGEEKAEEQLGEAVPADVVTLSARNP